MIKIERRQETMKAYWHIVKAVLLFWLVAILGLILETSYRQKFFINVFVWAFGVMRWQSKITFTCNKKQCR